MVPANPGSGASRLSARRRLRACSKREADAQTAGGVERPDESRVSTDVCSRQFVGGPTGAVSGVLPRPHHGCLERERVRTHTDSPISIHPNSEDLKCISCATYAASFHWPR